MTINIFLNISDIASFIGQNKWDYITPFERLWKKYDKDGYHLCLENYNNQIKKKKEAVILLENEKKKIELDLNNKNITKRQYNKLVKENELQTTRLIHDVTNLNNKIDSIKLTQSEKIEKALGKDIIHTISSSSKETEDKRKIAFDIIKTCEEEGKIDKEKKDELLKETESFINKTHGTLKEDSAIKLFEKEYNVTLDTSQVYYRYKVYQDDMYNWYIGGKMDGLYVDHDDMNKNYVVEVKNRTKGFFSSLREYEKTQIQLYLLLTGFQHAKLVEKYNSRIRVTPIEMEKVYIDDILEYVCIFIKKMIQFLKNDEMKFNYFSMSESDKKKFIHELYLYDINKLYEYKEELKIIQNEVEQDCLLSDLDEF